MDEQDPREVMKMQQHGAEGSALLPIPDIGIQW